MSRKITRKRREALACDLVDYLTRHDLFDPLTVIYVNGGAIYAEPRDGCMQKATPKRNSPYWFRPECACPCEYRNPDTLTMTFEGPLYHMLNDTGDSLTTAELNALFARYGLYYERGHAWSLSLYEI